MESPGRIQRGGSILGIIPTTDSFAYVVEQWALDLRFKDVALLFSLAYQ